VKWFVLASPVFISQIDYDRLRTAIPGTNNRPVQSVNGRTIVFDKTA
jgi:carbonic anhydrase